MWTCDFVWTSENKDSKCMQMLVAKCCKGIPKAPKVNAYRHITSYHYLSVMHCNAVEAVQAVHIPQVPFSDG